VNNLPVKKMAVLHNNTNRDYAFNMKNLLLLVMGIGNIYKIDDRYINIDRWSIIGDNCLLNVFTDYD
jgi:hypothetical protein